MEVFKTYLKVWLKNEFLMEFIFYWSIKVQVKRRKSIMEIMTTKLIEKDTKLLKLLGQYGVVPITYIVILFLVVLDIIALGWLNWDMMDI